MIANCSSVKNNSSSLACTLLVVLIYAIPPLMEITWPVM